MTIEAGTVISMLLLCLPVGFLVGVAVGVEVERWLRGKR